MKGKMRFIFILIFLALVLVACGDDKEKKGEDYQIDQIDEKKAKTYNSEKEFLNHMIEIAENEDFDAFIGLLTGDAIERYELAVEKWGKEESRRKILDQFAPLKGTTPEDFIKETNDGYTLWMHDPKDEQETNRLVFFIKEHNEGWHLEDWGSDSDDLSNE